MHKVPPKQFQILIPTFIPQKGEVMTYNDLRKSQISYCLTFLPWHTDDGSEISEYQKPGDV